ncbi:MAG: TonB-dependent siderophore receptor [Firmicutes bacterium]|nr:TonB-dependent siderophore receptor [Bacillota bacterium]
MQKKLSPAKKRLLYALLGSSLFWNTPVFSYAEDPANAVTTSGETEGEQTAAKEQASGQREFTFDEIKVTSKRDNRLPPAYAGGQVARGANLGVLGNKDFMDTPFTITSYTAQTITDQQASTLSDVLMNDASVRFTTSSGHINENYTIRGLDVNYEHLYFNGMQGLAPLNHVPVEFLERVEVLKGPSSFLYGGVNTSVGGAINLVPKRAGEEDITTFTTDYTSSSQLGGHIDIGRRFGPNKEWGIRFNGVYKDGSTETDGQSKERLLGALGLDYRHDRWRLSLDAYGSQESYDNGSISMYQLANGYVKAPDGSTNVLKGTYGTSRNNAVLFKGEYDFNNNWTAYASIGELASNSTGYLTGNHVRSFLANGNASVNLYNQYQWTDTVSSEFGLRGNYQTGSLKHQLILAANYTEQEQGVASVASNSGHIYTGISTNIYNPTSLASYLAQISSPSKPKTTSETDLSSWLVADTLSFDEDKVQLTLGLRHQNVKTKSYNVNNNYALTSSYESSANTPVVGLVVKPWGESVALYANYIEALSPGTTVTNTAYTNYGEVLAPYKSKQHELGVKWDRGRFTNTLAFFQITKPSQTTVNNVQAYDGEQKNRGIEWNTFGELAKNLRLLGGVTYLKGELVRTATAANEGNTPYGTPRWMMNTGVEWDTPWNPDLTLSFRAVYTGTQYLNNANTEKLPSWVRYDLGARYKTTINKVPVTFRASIENLFDKHYWSGAFSDNYVTLGGSRTFKLSATMQL